MQQSDSLWLAVNPPPFDKGGKGVGDFRGIVRFLEGLVQRSLSLATDKVERILKMLESQSKTIYGKK